MTATTATTASTTPADIETAAPRRVRRGRVAQIAVAALLALAIALGTAVFDAGSAEASGAPSVRACFVHRNGTAAGNLDTNLLRWNGGRWVVERNFGRTNAQGCAHYVGLQPNTAYYVRLHTVIGQHCPPFGAGVNVFQGFSNYGWTATSGRTDVGSVWVTHSRLC